MGMMKITALLLACAVATVAADSKVQDSSVDDFLTSVDLQDRMGCKDWCEGRYNGGETKVCGWGSCKSCDVCATAAPTEKLPKDVITSLGVNWKLQTPCEDGDFTAVSGGYQCAKRFNKLRRGGNKAPPKIGSVKVGSDLGKFTLKS